MSGFRPVQRNTLFPFSCAARIAFRALSGGVFSPARTSVPSMSRKMSFGAFDAPFF